MFTGIINWYNNQRVNASPLKTAQPNEIENDCLITYATKTGNAKDIAKSLYKMLNNQKVHTEYNSLSRIKPSVLTNTKKLFLVISTDGEGDLPAMAESFYKKLKKSDMTLNHLQFSILALGDSSYDLFCEAGKIYERLLIEKGATSILPRVDCDVDYTSKSKKWINNVSQLFAVSGSIPTVTDELATNHKKIKGIIHQVTPLSKGFTQAGCYHISIQCPDDISYIKPGDAIEIKPHNPDWMVLKVAHLLKITNDEKKLNALKKKLELTSVSKLTLEKYYQINPHQHLKTLLSETEHIKQFTNKANILDVFTLFPLPKGMHKKAFAILPKIKRRLYSVASSTANNTNEIHLTIKTIRFNFNEQMHEGAGSVQLTEYLELGNKITFKHKPNYSFRLPEDQSPIIMIGIGTGIAPFRGFLSEKQQLKRANHMWLIWGDKHQESDFLYEEELMQWQKNSTLEKLDLAFSRDEENKKYVQHIVEQKHNEILQWINQGAHIYVCGSIPMAKEVKNILAKVLSNHPSLSYDRLMELERYHEDAY